MVDTSKWVDTGIQAIVMVLAVWGTMKRYINGGITRIESKLDGHVAKVDKSLEGLTAKAGEITADVAGIKGYLGIGMPSRNVH